MHILGYMMSLMASQEIPDLKPTPPKKSGCMRALAITLLIVVIVGILVMFWVFRLLSTNPAFKKAFNQSQARQQCKLNLEEIGGALQRYSRRNGSYPTSLDQLYPNFLEKKASLHCPADPRPDAVSYDYYPPATNAPGTTLVAECRRHVMFENEPPWKLQLFKDGRVVSQGYLPRSGPAEQTTED